MKVAATLLSTGIILLAPISALAVSPKIDPIPVSPEVELCDGHSHQHTAAEHRAWTKKYVWNRDKVSKWAKTKHRHALACAAKGERPAIRKSWQKAKWMLLPQNHDLWLRIGRCELPGSGYGGVNWRNPGPTYQGGLGFYSATWSGWLPAKWHGKSTRRYYNAGLAPWRLQMVVAQRVANDVGYTAWGCY
jgi:hypothetical protein